VQEVYCKGYIVSVIKMAHDRGYVKRIDDKFIPEWFKSLRTVSYWQSQLRGSRLKNINSKTRKSTKNLYLYHLWNFEKWLHSKTFEINTLQTNKTHL